MYDVIHCVIPGDTGIKKCTIQTFSPELKKIYTFLERQPEVHDYILSQYKTKKVHALHIGSLPRD